MARHQLPRLDVAATEAKRAALLPRMGAQLAAVEAEMRRIGFWNENPPVLGRLRSYLDAPSFELWLQLVFLPNARQAVRDANVPAASEVGLMATRQYDYHSVVEKALPLVGLLSAFDRLVEDFARPVYKS